MLYTANLELTNTVNESDIADFFTNAAPVIHSTYHRLLKNSPCAAILERALCLTFHSLLTGQNKGRQKLAEKYKEKETIPCINWDCQHRNKELLQEYGIQFKTESQYTSDPKPITSIHTSGTIRVQCGENLTD